jgi:RNase P subunit RPR2
MADFCQDCSIEMFGKDMKDMADLCGEGNMILVICEGCGWIYVDNNGKKISEVGDKDV